MDQHLADLGNPIGKQCAAVMTPEAFEIARTILVDADDQSTIK